MSELTATIFNIQKFSLHDGPGIRSVVFFKGCPLRCFWCANPESQNRMPEMMWDNQLKKETIVGEKKTVAEVLQEVRKDQVFYEESGGGVTLSGGEVLLHAQFATELLKQLKQCDIHTAIETTGFADEKAFQQVTNYVDLCYFDIKHHNEEEHKKGVAASLAPILKNLTYALQTNMEVIVRIPIIPQFNDTLEDAKQFAQLFSSLGVKNVELLPFHQFGEKKYEYLNREYKMKDIPQLHAEDLLEHRKIFEEIGCVVK
ncbi:pyruvate formate lyase activating enzyme [Pilibacter termitis]|uniref:Pyruvate formate lyase activating enzyme n=1 Tax=Pilibacter termitis TaxID=263852 RepID=A0A1T4MH02_9ENTE|nr:glycyl-radical enzyme activating protein [Pilibacter termitis]SJZ66193.1 pyruvate formate lyase activating enzyme [Pilibacter termitis]